ncbi:NAD(P)/FAD-dependent oxidoreductase [Propionimicrobium sp. PCR01-08-3]|uniref:NAD(P)/FAD-dependent oxidoreductase n=1 Tax=Propionimicrobium sp. PCR01-08-3 TaxID=3052086 RepID=UPI00255CC953|nr:NAD(P)/FAD-dependent oxidoreductase [Propionimicrobium sp. PCR01-08-3]WIY82679.1 NAD(P)/FAD-dependent oxidoreductase [Propionimicrobium sp. PCR01-08-3]
MADSRVVIIGGGFAGLNAARELTSAGHEVMIIDRHAYTTFQPLLYQVATGALNPGDVTYSLRRWASNDRSHLASFRRATVTGIDFENKKVIVSRGEPIGYDKLLICPGVGANFFGIPGADRYTKQIYTRRQALEVRDIIFSGLELMAAERDPNKRFTAIVVGGGPTGVETAGALAEMKTQALPVLYPEIGVDNFHVVLVEMTDRLLGPFDRRLQRYTKRSLSKLGVDVRLNTAVKEVFADHVDFADGTKLDCDIVVWASGVGVRPAVKDWGLPQGRGGRILVEPDQRVVGFDDVYAAGDASICESEPQPQLAQPAIQQGKLVAHNIMADKQGGVTETFHYNDKGTMATIGRNAAVVQLPQGAKITGFPAWLLWVLVHIATLLGGRNRISAMLNMAVRYISWPKSAVGIIGDYVDAPSRLPASAQPENADDENHSQG